MIDDSRIAKLPAPKNGDKLNIEVVGRTLILPITKLYSEKGYDRMILDIYESYNITTKLKVGYNIERTWKFKERLIQYLQSYHYEPIDGNIKYMKGCEICNRNRKYHKKYGNKKSKVLLKELK